MKLHFRESFYSCDKKAISIRLLCSLVSHDPHCLKCTTWTTSILLWKFYPKQYFVNSKENSILTTSLAQIRCSGNRHEKPITTREHANVPHFLIPEAKDEMGSFSYTSVQVNAVSLLLLCGLYPSTRPIYRSSINCIAVSTNWLMSRLL